MSWYITNAEYNVDNSWNYSRAMVSALSGSFDYSRIIVNFLSVSLNYSRQIGGYISISLDYSRQVQNYLSTSFDYSRQIIDVLSGKIFSTFNKPKQITNFFSTVIDKFKSERNQTKY